MMEQSDRSADTDPCNEALLELYHFLHGELTEHRRALINSHIESCSSCLEIYDFEAEFRVVIAERCRDEVPESLRLRIARLIELEP